MQKGKKKPMPPAKGGKGKKKKNMSMLKALIQGGSY